jgi:hypothetical protein
VAQLDAALTTLNQATYLGGSGGTDESVAIAIHPITGEVYVTGQTDSVESPGTDSTGFPGTAGGAQNEGGIFVARLNPDLTTLGQATYLGKGCEEAYPHAMAIASKSGDVYVAGEARANCSGTAGGAQPSNGGRMDVFVARLNANLTALAQATYLGAGGDERAIGVSIQPLTGDMYLTGFTDSSDFPGTAGGVQAESAGMGDAFLARLGGSLTTLKQATYLGGTRSDSASAVAIHPVTGELFVAGVTESLDFPGTAGGPQSEYGDGASDGFIARLSPDLRGSGSLLNSFVTFNPVTTTSSTSSPTSGCPAGVFRIKARLRNTSAHVLSHLRAEVATLTNGNLLKNADGGPGGVGAIMTIPAGGAYADGVLAPNEFVDVSFAICLTKKSAFDFFVDVFGTAE